MLALLIGACGPTGAVAPTSPGTSATTAPTPRQHVTIRLSNILAVSDAVQNELVTFAADVASRSNGDIDVQLFPAGQLYKAENESVAAVQRGEIQMAVHTNAAFAALVPVRNILDIPFKFASWDSFHQNVNGRVGEILEQATEDKGIKVLGWLDYTTIDLIGTVGKVVQRPEDLKGLRLRSYSEALSEAMKAWNSAPTIISGGDVYTAVQRGTVDGLISGSGFYERKWYEVTPFLTQLPVNLSSLPIAVNLAFWNKLPAEYQKIMIDAVKAIEAKNRVEMPTITADGYTKMKTQVKGWYVVPQSEVGSWQKSVSTALDAWYVDRAGDLGKQVLAALK
jgi:C4-dicarboxylate-binding protein DctP